jgi:GrpB-like predicted nucleotidyltransferase (UPF0157 family)
MTSSDPEFDAYLDEVIVGERGPIRVSLSEYDESWPQRFDEHRSRIRAALPDRARMIEHIGSTSVPGLAAKPIIDVLVVVDDIDDESAYLPALESAGYELRVREPGHRMVRPSAHDAHAHIYGANHPEIAACLAFRDRLRADATDRATYEAVKRELATHTWPDMNYYARAKSEVIQSVLAHVPSSGAPPG